MTTERYLDEIEIGLLDRPYIEFVEYRGILDEPTLRRAATLMASRYTLLRSRIVSDGVGFVLQVPPGGTLRFHSVPGGYDELAHEAEGPWDSADGVAEIIHVHNGRRGYVALRTDHAAIDGASIMAMLEYLWETYTDLVHGADRIPEPGLGLPAGPYKLMARPGGIGAHALAAAINPSRNGFLGPPVNNRFALTATETAAVVAAARAQNTSVHGLVCGAILVAQRSLSERTTAPGTMACWSFVDLRQSVTPAVAATDTTYFAALQKAEIDVAADSDPLALGCHVKDRLDAGLRGGEAIPGSAFRDIDRLTDTLIEPRLSTVTVTNMGVIPTFTEPAELSIVEFGNLPPSSMSVPFPIFRVYTYKGKMTVFSSHPSDYFGPGEVTLLTQRTAAALRTFGAR